MKLTSQIVIERPLEKVFLWMFQAQPIVQLVTWDLAKGATMNGPTPTPPTSKYRDDPKILERVARQQRFMGHSETKIEIENLTTPTLHVGTTFEYRMSTRNLSPEFPAFSAWKLMYPGSITIEESIPFTFFSFMARRSLLPEKYSRNDEHCMTFQAQKEKTIMTHTRLTNTRMISSFIISTLFPPMVAFRKEAERRQLLSLKAQMEAEID